MAGASSTFTTSLTHDLRTLLGARLKAGGNALRLALREARLRVVTAFFVACVFWFGLFGLFYSGFRFINANAASFKPLVLVHLFGLFFVTLMVMLVFSNAIISYMGLFQSRETAFLMSQPLRAGSVFAYKFAESLVFSSWAFVLLGTPLLVAYGVTSDVPWYFYLTFFLYLPPFVVIPAVLGTLASLLVAAYVPRRRLGWLLVVLGAAVVVAGVVIVKATPVREMLPFSDVQLRWFFMRLRFTREPLLPSHWMTQGILAAAQGNLSRVAFYLLVLLSNALFASTAAYLIAERVYRGAWHRAQSGRRRRRRVSRRWLDAVVHRVFFYLSPPARLLVVKDLRTFRRDPAQWSQFIIFFGILAAYVGNLRSLAYHLRPERFRAMVSLLNLSVVAMVVSTFACRFVFPLVSLEGRNFWLLGLAPIRRRSVLLGKFVFAAAGASLMSLVLVVTSDLLLRSPPRVILLDAVAMLLMSVGIGGISVGLGARLPNLDEDNPSKIAAGFGGTLDLVVSLFYIAVVVALMAVPAHRLFAGEIGLGGGFVWAALWGVLAAVGVTAVAIALPMTVGIRHFRRMEF